MPTLKARIEASRDFSYRRVSTDKQQTGLESQIRGLKKFCYQNDIKEYELFTDENISGAKAGRPLLSLEFLLKRIDIVLENKIYPLERS